MENLAARIILLSGWRRALVAMLAGAVAALSQPPFDFFAVCFLAFPVLVWLLDGAASLPLRGRPGRFWPGFRIGWMFGFGYFVAGLWWVGNALLVESDEFAWALPLAVFGLPAVLAVFYGFATGLARFVWPDGLGRIFMLAACFGIAEYLRATLLTGFPWNAIGYAAMPAPMLMQSASVIGVFAMTPLAVFVFAAPALLGTRKHRAAALALALLLAAAHAGYGYWRLSQADVSGPVAAVRIVQPSIDQTRKWDASVRDSIFARLIRLSKGEPVAAGASASPAQKPQFIVWPETAVPYLITEKPEALRTIAGMVEDGQILLTGAVRSEPGASASEQPRYYNSILAIDSAGEIVAAADKLHLVPFGEYLPFRELLENFGLTQVANVPGVFSPGQRRSVLELPGARFLPLVCFEAIFPQETVFGGGDGAFLVVTNDAWYGATPGPYQHFRQAQLRAVEQGVSLVRAANNGVSGVVDPYGRVVDAFALDVTGALDVTVPLGRVPTWYSRYGLVHLQLIVIVFLAIALSMGVLPAWRRQ